MKQHLFFSRTQEPEPVTTEDYFGFQFAREVDNSDAGFYIVRLSDHAIRHVSPPWGSIDDGYIYNNIFVRGESVFIPNFREQEPGYWYSSDLGVNFSKIVIGSNTDFGPTGIHVSQDEKYQLYIHINIGIWVSDDYGVNWTNKLPYPMWDGGINYDGSLMISSNDDGVWVSNNYGVNWTQIETATCRSSGIAYNSGRAFYVTLNGVYEYDFSTEQTATIATPTWGNYPVRLGASYVDDFLTGDANQNLYNYTDDEGEETTVSVLADKYYGNHISYDGKVRVTTGNYDGAISFDYGQTWEIFDPINFNTF